MTDLANDLDGAVQSDVADLDRGATSDFSITVPVRRRRAPGEAAGTRREHDVYDTHPNLALACVQWCAANLTKSDTPNVIEPCAGSGPFVAGARSVWPDAKIVAIDVRAEVEADCMQAGATRFLHLDATTLPPAALAKADLIVSNPPFKLADQIVRALWPGMRSGASLAFLLSCTFIGSEDRWRIEPDGLFRLAPLHFMVPIVPRPEFTGESPKFEACLYVWTKDRELFPAAGYGALIPSEPLRWQKPKKSRAKRNGAPSAT